MKKLFFSLFSITKITSIIVLNANHIELQPAIEHEMIRWVLGEAGRIAVLVPAELRRKVAEAGAAIQRINFGEVAKGTMPMGDQKI